MNLEDVEGLAVLADTMKSWSLASTSRLPLVEVFWCHHQRMVHSPAGCFKQSRTVAFTVTRSQLHSSDVRPGEVVEQDAQATDRQRQREATMLRWSTISEEHHKNISGSEGRASEARGGPILDEDQVETMRRLRQNRNWTFGFKTSSAGAPFETQTLAEPLAAPGDAHRRQLRSAGNRQQRFPLLLHHTSTSHETERDPASAATPLSSEMMLGTQTDPFPNLKGAIQSN